MTLEDAHLNTETLKAMKTSAQAMKQTVKEADLDKAEDLMDDIQEAMDQVQEMNDAMSQPIGYLNDIDDAELEAELDELDQLDADELLTAAPDPPMKSQANDNSNVLADLPNAPTGKVAAKDDDNEDKQLAELEAMMS